MKIIKRSLSDKAMKANDYRQRFAIVVDGTEKISVGDGGEPEDNALGRDLNFVYDIVPLMKLAFEAGARGENLEIVSEQVEDAEEMY